MFEKFTSAITNSSTDEFKKPWMSSSNASKPKEPEIKEASPPKKQELVYYSSRSRHKKTKVKEITPKESGTPTSRLSTVASLVNVPHNVLSGRGSRLASGGSSSTTVFGSVGNASNATGTTVAYRSSERGNSITTEDDGKDEDQLSKYSEYGYSPTQSLARLSVTARSEESIWWDEQKIQETVTKEFIVQQLNLSKFSSANLTEKLDIPVAFGNGLTNTTYAEWICQRARKFFLILVELGIPEQAFLIVDNSWDDGDLPMNAEGVEQLRLCHPRDVSMEKKFLKVQNHYNLRFINPDMHVDYEVDELVPLDIHREPKHSRASSISSGSDRVSQPRQKYQVYIRKQIPIGHAAGTVHPQDLMDEIEEMRAITHEHVVKLFASYTHRGHGFFLLSPPTEITLKRFLNSPPPAYKKLAEDVRRFKLLDWMHCLADALAYLYDRGVPHQDIRPKSIVIEEKTAKIMFADIGSFRRMDPQGRWSGGDHAEYYMYGAPELWQRGVQYNVSTSPTARQVVGGSRTGRRPSKTEKEQVHDEIQAQIDTAISTGDAPENLKTSHGSSKHVVRVGEWVSKPAAKSDIFSLGCIFLEVLTFHSKKKTLSQFAAHRQKKHRAAGSRGGAVADASFHANLETVGTWIKTLKKEALDRDDDAVQTSLILCSQIMKREPEERPTPREACTTLFNIMKTVRRLHCEFHFEPAESSTHSFSNWSGWDDPHQYGRTGSETSMGRPSTSSTSGSSVDSSFSDRASRHSHGSMHGCTSSSSPSGCYNNHYGGLRSSSYSRQRSIDTPVSPQSSISSSSFPGGRDPLRTGTAALPEE